MPYLYEEIEFNELDKHIVQKAINILAKQEGALYRLENLRDKLSIGSMDALRTAAFLGDLKLKISTTKSCGDITNREWLDCVALKFLVDMAAEIGTQITPKRGSEFTQTPFKEVLAEPKVKYTDSSACRSTEPIMRKG